MTATSTDFLAAYAAAQPDTTAVVEGDTALTYDELNRVVNRTAAALQELGVAAGTKVIWCAQNGIEVVTLINAARKAGAVAVPLNYRLSTEEAAYVIDNSDAEVVLFDGEQTAQLDGARASCPKVRHWVAFRTAADDVPTWARHLEGMADAAPDDEVTPRGTADDSGATIIYTSGTTGKPKGAVRGTTNMEAAIALLQHIGFELGDVYLTTGPLYHSGPLAFMAVAQQVGGTVIVQRHFDAEEWLALVDRHQVTTTFSAPTPVRRIVDLPAEVRARYDFSSMKRFIANAAPWPFELKRRYVEAFGDTSLFEVYGSTELGVNTVLRPEDQMRKPGSCGRPAPMIEIALFDPEGNQVSEPGVPGELYVRQSGNVFETYYKADDKYEANRRGEWLTVGDIAYVDDEGFYFICDRKSDMIISGGMNIYPAEIEAVLVAHHAVADAAVFGVPDDEWGESVHAAVTLYPDATADDDDIRAFCREHLASYKVPRGIDHLDEIPRSASGKILKKELRAPYWEGRTVQVG